MGQVIILGSANAIPDDLQDNTHMLVKSDTRCILVDAANNPVPRLIKVGIGHDEVSDLILTHFHPDHVSGVPQLLMGWWLLGRRRTLDVYGLPHTLQRVKAMLDLYELLTWPDFFEVRFHEIPELENQLVLEDESMRVLSSPVKHLIPTLGIRVEFIKDKRSFAYSCDTEPCQAVVDLAKDVDILVHEATGQTVGHTSAAQAGEVAQQAQAKALFLIHYSIASQPVEQLMGDAHSTFQGAVHLARDLMTLEF
ncbi:MAG: MBL fold metallo-hydrolase [Anaerolineae bacterium]|nr:MBL fold metallo-hydrolase [Anaerolineae bacterium]